MNLLAGFDEINVGSFLLMLVDSVFFIYPFLIVAKQGSGVCDACVEHRYTENHST